MECLLVVVPVLSYIRTGILQHRLTVDVVGYILCTECIHMCNVI